MVGFKIFYEKYKYEIFYIIFLVLILFSYSAGIHQGEYRGMKIICGDSDIVYNELEQTFFCGSLEKYNEDPNYMYNFDNISFENIKFLN